MVVSSKRFVPILLFALAFLMIPAKQANAGVYRFIDCNPSPGWNIGLNWTGLLSYTASPSASAFDSQYVKCNPLSVSGQYDHITSSQLRTKSGRSYSKGDTGYVRYILPDGLRFAGGAWLTANANNGSGFSSDIMFNDAGGTNQHSIKGTSYYYFPNGQGRKMLRGLIKCSNTSCTGSGSGSPSVTLLYPDLTIEDTTAPQLYSYGGSLSYSIGTPDSGVETLSVTGTDIGSGVHRLIASVNGTQIFNVANSACKNLTAIEYSVFVPCPATMTTTQSVDTTKAPWKNGPNLIEMCVRDYAGSPGASAPSYLSSKTANEGCGFATTWVQN